MHIAVQALERAKSMGTVENVEELLIVVAERVKERQRQKLQFQKNNNSVQVCYIIVHTLLSLELISRSLCSQTKLKVELWEKKMARHQKSPHLLLQHYFLQLTSLMQVLPIMVPQRTGQLKVLS